ncbi:MULTISPECIES: hypothetical protein [Haloferax]|nr:hypothetical protein [Haloferax mediterranei]MDX5989194.1 hypothetical protein [Haloferax mediterranei ATCC 33500]
MTLWQEVGLAVLLVGTLVAFAVSGGVIAGLEPDILGELREELSSSS